MPVDSGILNKKRKMKKKILVIDFTDDFDRFYEYLSSKYEIIRPERQKLADMLVSECKGALVIECDKVVEFVSNSDADLIIIDSCFQLFMESSDESCGNGFILAKLVAKKNPDKKMICITIHPVYVGRSGFGFLNTIYGGALSDYHVNECVISRIIDSS